MCVLVCVCVCVCVCARALWGHACGVAQSDMEEDVSTPHHSRFGELDAPARRINEQIDSPTLPVAALAIPCGMYVDARVVRLYSLCVCMCMFVLVCARVAKTFGGARSRMMTWVCVFP